MSVPDRRWELEQRFAVRGVGSEPEQRALELEQQRGVPRGLGTILEGGDVTVGPREMPSGGSAREIGVPEPFLVGPRGLERQGRDPLWSNMKRYGFLYDRIIDPDNLYAAFLDARRCKRSKRACFAFERGLGSNLQRLRQELLDGTYAPRPYYSFVVYEPKPRTIHAPAFRDVVVQHAVSRVISPIFERTFINQSFACRRGMGTHKAADYAQEALRASPPGSYTIKLDIRKFFYRIDRTILRGLLERKIKDERTLNLAMTFADHGEATGIPIGNLLSQLYSLIYLNELDHFAKRVLKARRYCRYVDDFIVFGVSRQEAERIRDEVVAFISSRLNLELSRYTIARCARGVNFVGYRTWASKRFVRRHSMFVLNRRVRQNRLEAVVSCLGHAAKTHSLQHFLTTISRNNNALYHRLPQGYRRSHHALPPPPAR
jgi:retron-type reverse transcriptase